MTEKPDYNYVKDKGESKDDILKDIGDHVKRSKQIRQLNEANPHEQALKFDEVRKNPPDPDFMRVGLYQKIDELGNANITCKSKNLKSGEEQEISIDPFFVFSPHIGFDANIAKAPLNVMGILLDETELIAIETKKAFKPEKHIDEKNFGWVWVIVLIGGAVAAGSYLLVSYL